MIHTELGFIAVFSAEGWGTVVSSSLKDYPNGMHREDWDMNEFEEYFYFEEDR
jgi:hypothetical protein